METTSCKVAPEVLSAAAAVQSLFKAHLLYLAQSSAARKALCRSTAMLCVHTGRMLHQVFSQASGTGGFVDTMTSGSFNVSLCLLWASICSHDICPAYLRFCTAGPQQTGTKGLLSLLSSGRKTKHRKLHAPASGNWHTTSLHHLQLLFAPDGCVKLGVL